MRSHQPILPLRAELPEWHGPASAGPHRDRTPMVSKPPSTDAGARRGDKAVAALRLRWAAARCGARWRGRCWRNRAFPHPIPTPAKRGNRRPRAKAGPRPLKRWARSHAKPSARPDNPGSRRWEDRASHGRKHRSAVHPSWSARRARDQSRAGRAGSRRPLLEGLNSSSIKVDLVRVIDAPGVTHLTYRVIKTHGA